MRPRRPSPRSSAPVTSSENGSEASTSSIGASSSASATENSPTVNSRSRSSSLVAPPSSSHMRARRSASATSWSGTSGTDAERDDRGPAADGARAEQGERLAHGVDLARQREERRVDVAQQRDREPDVGADDALEVLERRLARGQLRERLQRGDRALADAVAALAARAGEELALEVREAEHPAARELVRGGDAGGDQHEPALGRLGDQRAQLVVARARARGPSRSRSARAAARCPRSRRARARSPPRPAPARARAARRARAAAPPGRATARARRRRRG